MISLGRVFGGCHGIRRKRFVPKGREFALREGDDDFEGGLAMGKSH